MASSSVAWSRQQREELRGSPQPGGNLAQSRPKKNEDPEFDQHVEYSYNHAAEDNDVHDAQ